VPTGQDKTVYGYRSQSIALWLCATATAVESIWLSLWIRVLVGASLPLRIGALYSKYAVELV